MLATSKAAELEPGAERVTLLAWVAAVDQGVPAARDGAELWCVAHHALTFCPRCGLFSAGPGWAGLGLHVQRVGLFLELGEVAVRVEQVDVVVVYVKGFRLRARVVGDGPAHERALILS